MRNGHQIKRQYILAILFVILLIGSNIAQATPPSAEDFIPEFLNVQISPDGEHVASIRPFEGRNALVIYRFAETPAMGGRPVSVIPSGDDVDIISYRWANNEKLLIYVGWAFQNVSQWWNFDFDTLGGRLVSINLDGTDVHFVGDIGMGNVLSILPDEEDTILLQRWEDWRIRAYRYNLNTGRFRSITTGQAGDGYYVADQSGEIRAMMAYGRWVDYSAYWRNPTNNSWRRALRYEFEEGRGLSLAGFGDHGNDLYFSSNHEGRWGIYLVDPRENEGFERFYLHDEVDSIGLGTDDNGLPLYVTILDDVIERVYLDADFEALDRKFSRDLPGEFDLSIQTNDDGTRHVISSQGAGRPEAYYLYDREEDIYYEFAPIYPNLANAELAPIERRDYVARDGLNIRSYLTLPANAGAGPLPLVVMPHGGPFARDNMHFDPLRQFVATRGYAVFTPNYRGSTGLGNDFHEAGWGEWGEGMQEDVNDGIRELIAQGIADPDRICIVGWSYGAYAALHGAATTPDMFQCAVGINGVYDIPNTRAPRQFRFSGAGSWAGEEVWDHFIGSAQFDRDAMRALSPTYNAGRIQIPILLVASAQDPIARIAQSEEMAQALRRAGVEHSTLFFSEGDHSMTYGARTRTYERIEYFLAAHLQ